MSNYNNELTLDDLEGLELTDWDAAESLTSDEAIAAFMSDIIAAGDHDLFNSALGDVARARGMVEIAQKAGMTREGLYKALRPSSKPRFETIAAIVKALGMSIRIYPADQFVAPAALPRNDYVNVIVKGEYAEPVVEVTRLGICAPCAPA